MRSISFKGLLFLSIEKSSWIAMMQNMMQNAQAEETEQKPWVSKSGGDFLECTLSNMQSPLTQIRSDKLFPT